MKTSHLNLIAGTLIAVARLHAVDLPLIDDAQILQNNATWNYGAHGNLGVVSTQGSQRYSFLKFDVHNALPVNTRQDDIEQAWLYLYVNDATTPGKFAVHKVTGELWTTATNTIEGKGTGTVSAVSINWTRGSGVATTPYTTFDYTAGLQDELVVIEVTDLVKEWLAGSPGSNYGLAFKPTGVTGESVNLLFDSKENANASHHPRIEVTLNKKRIAPKGDVTMGAFTNGLQP